MKSSKVNFGNTKKHLGQNWLVDEKAISKFVDFCDISKSDNVLEIGLGNMALTLPLVKFANKVVSIEIDNELVKNAQLKVNSEKLIVNNNLSIINTDFLQLDLSEIIKNEQITTIVSALPYNITSPIIHKIIQEATSPLKNVCLITQKEFAQKIIGTDKKRSYFTNLVEKYGKIIPGDDILNTSFYPVPKVDSMYFKISLDLYPQNIYEVKQWEKFLHHAYRTPRKKLNKAFDKSMLQELKIDENLRPENLTIKQLQLLNNRATEQ